MAARVSTEGETRQRTGRQILELVVLVLGSIEGLCCGRSRPGLPVDLEAAHLVLDLGLEQEHKKDD